MLELPEPKRASGWEWKEPKKSKSAATKAGRNGRAKPPGLRCRAVECRVCHAGLQSTFGPACLAMPLSLLFGMVMCIPWQCVLEVCNLPFVFTGGLQLRD